MPVIWKGDGDSLWDGLLREFVEPVAAPLSAGYDRSFVCGRASRPRRQAVGRRAPVRRTLSRHAAGLRPPQRRTRRTRTRKH